ncbi:hypothetical protein [Campylobacter mucosalis]|uniref:DUF177 domain protein n=1 Tax=Campylobacter mucosalis CCUG 21559 TaxID=1032067 RepID=A0A6G5QF27_9BACT|nr:hypothetical protein [Campylobacter mucosalis]QCD44252.1 hypothetical protein CMUC_0439 [Campylobacter mucosalis CCUG 21559]
MKLSFLKVTKQPSDFKLEKDSLNFSGFVVRQDPKIVKCQGKILGNTPHICDRCGDEISLQIDQDVDLLLSDGVYKDEPDELSNIFEFFDGEINFDDIFVSEIEAYKSDYFYCENCKNL